jgi:hypothetical protein
VSGAGSAGAEDHLQLLRVVGLLVERAPIVMTPWPPPIRVDDRRSPMTLSSDGEAPLISRAVASRKGAPRP